jgi:hypothetical protein
MRRMFYSRAGTLDAEPNYNPDADTKEPTGLSRETGGNKGSGPARFVAQLPGSASDYFITTSGDGSGRADLWQVEHARGDPGVNPLDSDAVRGRLSAADRAYRRSPTADRGRELGKAIRLRDSVNLRSINAANAARYSRGAA